MDKSYHLRPLVGRIATELLTFTPGHSITLGREADCEVTADGVLGLHGCLAYFEEELWALSSSVAQPIFVDGLPAIMWTAVREGAILSVGSARIRISMAEAPIDVDLSDLRRPSYRMVIPRYGAWMSTSH